ncbi:hypothetical protein [Streptomyces sp. NPDC050485]|uniref:hypothetical protein n=1 Tax=Streptomyces sp. NPDC050485 TaxID=3365617 RepID=UPI0037BAAA6A
MSPAPRQLAIRRRLGLIGLLLALFTMVLAPAAFADPSPTPTPSTSASPTPDKPANGDKEGPEADKKSKDGSDGILQPFNVTDKDGVPISAYSVRTDTGGWKDIDLKIWNILAQFLFGVAKWVIGFTCWLIKWALNFGLAEILIGPVDNISNTIKHQVIDRLGLPGLFLLFAGFYAGWLILFKERSRGFAEIGVSLVVAAVATTVLVSPAQVLLGQHQQEQPQGSTMLLSSQGLLGKAKDFTVEVASIVLSHDPANAKGSSDPNNVAKPITDALVDAFIVKPNELMVYGQTFDGACDKEFRQFKLTEFQVSETGLNYWEAQKMDSMYNTTIIDTLNKSAAKFQAACGGTMTTEAKRASADLVFSALFLAVAAIIVAVLMVLVTGGFLTAQGWLAFEAIRGHWALCAGILPGGGRATLWRWFSAVVKAVLGVMLAILFLAIFILIILALIDSDTGNVLAVKFIVIDVTAIAGLAGHKRIKQTAQNIAVNLNRKLANARVGGSRRSVFTSPGRYAETAPGLKQIWGEARGEARRMSQPVGKGLKTARNAWVGSPQANRKASRLRTATRLATNAAAAIGTGGASTAAKAAAQQAAKQTLKKRLATAAANKMSQTRGGRATLKTGKAAAATAKYGTKATKFAFMATVGAPVGIPRGVAATKRGGAAAMARGKKVAADLQAVKARTVDKKVQEAKDFGAEYKRNVAAAGKFVAKSGTKAQVNLGLAQIQPNPRAATPPGTRARAIAPQTPGGTSGAKTAGAKTGSVKPPAAGATAVPHMPTPAQPAPPTPSAAKKSTPSKPPATPRVVRRATRPPGPPKPRP